MNEQGGNKGLWAALIAVLLAALTFVVLWYLRGGEVDRVNRALQSAQTQATSTAQRLERDLRQAQTDAETRARRIAELENQVRDEQRRASETTQQMERRLRGEIDAYSGRVRDLAAELERVRGETAEQANAEMTALRGQLEQARQALAEAEKAGSDASGRAARLEDGMNELNARLERADAALRETRNLVENHPEVARLTGELRQSTAALGALQQRHDELRNRLESAGGDRTLSDSEKELAAARAVAANLEKRLTTLITGRRQLRTALEEAQGQLEEARAQLNEQADVPARLKAAETRIVALESERDDIAGRLREAREDRSAEERIAQRDERLTAAAASLTALEKRAAEAEAARDAAVKDLGAARDALTPQLDAAKKTIAELQGTVGDLRASNNDIGRELTSANQELTKAEAAGEGLRKELEALKQSRQRLIAANSQELAKAKTEGEALRKEIEALKQSQQTLIAAGNQELAKAKTEGEALRKELEASKQSQQKLIAANSQELAKAKTEGEALRKELEALQQSQQKLIAAGNQELAKAKTEGEALRKELETLRQSHQKLTDANQELLDAEETLRLHIEEITKDRQKQPDAPVAAENAAAPGGEAAIVIDPVRSVGRIIDKLADGRYIIDSGRRQGVRPGMRFDVHRLHDGFNRFAGILQVTQPMEDISIAMPVPGADTAICPVTGRAYLEPGARYSPYAMAADGGPVPLIAAASVGLDRETPRVGDSIDNPFFTPGRKVTFALCGDVAHDAQALRAVNAMGGEVRADATAAGTDYLVVGKDGAFSGDAGGPRRVTREHVLKYISVPIPVAR